MADAGHSQLDDAALTRAALRSDRFRLQREGEWRRLETVLKRIEQGRLRRISDDDLLALPALYRTAVASLGVARATSLDAALVGYLEALAQRAWFAVYGPRESMLGWFGGFFRRHWRVAVQGIRGEILAAFALLVLGTVTGWLLCAADADWYYTLVGDDPAGRVPGASRPALASTLFGHDQRTEGLGVFAAFLAHHNAQVAILAFSLGFAFGVPTVLLILQNGAALGAMLWLFHGAGLTLELTGWLTVHGTTELFAIVLAGAAGMHIGRALALPGQLVLLDAAQAAGRRAAVVMIGVVLMLVVAGLLEAFARQLLDATAPRMAVGLVMLALWLGYFWPPLRLLRGVRA